MHVWSFGLGLNCANELSIYTNIESNLIVMIIHIQEQSLLGHYQRFVRIKR